VSRFNGCRQQWDQIVAPPFGPVRSRAATLAELAQFELVIGRPAPVQPAIGLRNLFALGPNWHGALRLPCLGWRRKANRFSRVPSGSGGARPGERGCSKWAHLLGSGTSCCRVGGGGGGAGQPTRSPARKKTDQQINMRVPDVKTMKPRSLKL